MTPSRRRQLLVDDIRAYAAQLTDCYRAHETLYTKTRGGRTKLVGVHTETHDGLLAQLAEIAVHGVTSSTDNPGARPVPQSTPPGHWEALGRGAAIAAEAARWCWDLDLPLRDTTQGNIRQLAAAAGELRIVDDDQVAALCRAMRLWRAQAQALIGWTSEAYRPRATCPILTCGKADTLRVNLARKSAFCLECLSVWDDVDGSINVLAEHIAAQTEARAVTTERIRSGHSGHGGAWLPDHPNGQNDGPGFAGMSESGA
ncbi:hypothetical protein KIF24_01950 [Micromonospora sp. Llam7]|uniref:DUF7341 domain-containing protein n=1 Tax=Micromonospora tarapacensis TaxID=2835305 RepID=UPI001C82C03B|nr:hypothetical protein [Micromonospora tarapacensis]MBX7264937.1 hypothetical protein [Micromonospora tarapacensis]